MGKTIAEKILGYHAEREVKGGDFGLAQVNVKKRDVLAEIA